MKDNNNDNIDDINIFLNNQENIEIDQGMSDEENVVGSNYKKKDDSLEKYFKPLEENKDTNDILKELENLNLSAEKSFDTAFDHPNINTQKKNTTHKKSTNPIINDDIINNINKNENVKFKNVDLNLEINTNDNKKLLTEKEIFNGINDEDNENENLSEFLLKEKINRICTSFQGYSLSQKCYIYLNNFIPLLPELNQKLYKPIDNLFDVFIELLTRIKQEFAVKENLIHKLNDISLNNEGYEKKLLKLKKEIKNKEREICTLINKVNLEKEKKEDNSKSKILEINSLKKENLQLNNKLTLFKNQIRKTEADYKAIQNKLKYYIMERENKNNSSNFDNNSIKGNNSKLTQQQEDYNNINNEKYLAIKKLNMNLVYLLKEINKNLCKYDYGLNKLYIEKMNKAEEDNEMDYEIEDLNSEIETNLLVDENNNKKLYKHFMFNMDIINSKIIDILKKNTQILQNFSKVNVDNKNKHNKNKKEGEDDRIKNKVNYEFNNTNNYNNNNDKININIRNNNIANNVKKNKNNYNLNNYYRLNNSVNTDNINIKNKKSDINNIVNKNKSNTRKSFLNFYNNDDKDLEENIETRAVIEPTWYDNLQNKNVGYVFDKNKILTCNDDEINGAKHK